MSRTSLANCAAGGTGAGGTGVGGTGVGGTGAGCDGIEVAGAAEGAAADRSVVGGPATLVVVAARVAERVDPSVGLGVAGTPVVDESIRSTTAGVVSEPHATVITARAAIRSHDLIGGEAREGMPGRRGGGWVSQPRAGHAP